MLNVTDFLSPRTIQIDNQLLKVVRVSMNPVGLRQVLIHTDPTHDHLRKREVELLEK